MEAPKVNLTASISKLSAAGSVTLMVRATDNNGSDGYKHTLSFPHSEANNGSHSYTAKAYDAQNNSAESDSISISVDIDATPPTNVFLFANPTSLSAPGTITLSASGTDQHGVAAADNSRIARVEFYKGTEKIGEDNTRNDGFSHTINYDASYQGTDSFSASIAAATCGFRTSATRSAKVCSRVYKL